MNLNEAKRILNKNGYFLKEDARRNNTDISDIFSLIDVHDWSPKLVAEEIMKHYYEEPITVAMKHYYPPTVDYIDRYNYKDYIDKEYINVKGDVDLSNLNLTKLPIRFGTVGGGFYCNNNKLTTLEGAPKKVGGDFYCNNNKLTTLKGAPEKVRGDFDCSNNKLTSLKGAPEVVVDDFHCYDNEVKFTEDDVLKVSNVKGKINL